MKLFAQIRKVDEERRLVYGRAADESPDKAKEKMDYAGSKPHFEKWSADMSKDTNGKSLGNVRAMHGKVAAGVLKDIAFDDAACTIDVCAKVVDDNEWKKVLEGVYTGFSIGGAYGEKTVEKVDGEDYTKYVAIPNEISLVDRPCIPTAKFFQVQKVDGTTAEVAFKEPIAEVAKVEVAKVEVAKVEVAKVEVAKTETTAEGTVDGTPEQVDQLTAIMAEKGLSISDVIALTKGENPFAAKGKDTAPKGIEQAAWDKMDAKEKAAAKAEAEKVEQAELKKATSSELRKGMYECSQFAQIIAALQSLKSSAAYESYREGDNSPVPQALDACISMCAGVLKQMIDEEVAEVGDTGVPQPVMAMAEQCGELAKHEGDPLLVLVKYGARNSGQDKSRIEAIHKASVELGAECTPAAKEEGAGDLQKSTTDLAKMIEDAVAPMQKALTDAQEQIKRLEAQPAPTKVVLRAVSKAQDNGDAEVNPTEADLVKDAHGAVHPAASLIKQAMAQGGAPLVYRG
jgi:hypothetical protein